MHRALFPWEMLEGAFLLLSVIWIYGLKLNLKVHRRITVCDTNAQGWTVNSKGLCHSVAQMYAKYTDRSFFSESLGTRHIATCQCDSMPWNYSMFRIAIGKCLLLHLRHTFIRSRDFRNQGIGLFLRLLKQLSLLSRQGKSKYMGFTCLCFVMSS